MSKAWHGGKGSVRRQSQVGELSKETVSGLGCGFCKHYLMIKKKCMLKEGEVCPKKS